MANDRQAMSALMAALKQAENDVHIAVQILREHGKTAEVVREGLPDGMPCEIRVDGVPCIPILRSKNRSS